MDQTIYQRKGYKDRQDYLISLADEYGVNTDAVFAVAAMMGESEDFDGLLNILEDAECIDVSER